MKTILFALLLCSCTSVRILYDDSYNFKIYSGSTMRIYYTNDVSIDSGFVCFTDHEGQRVCLSNAEVIHLK